MSLNTLPNTRYRSVPYSQNETEEQQWPAAKTHSEEDEPLETETDNLKPKQDTNIAKKSSLNHGHGSSTVLNIQTTRHVCCLFLTMLGAVIIILVGAFWIFLLFKNCDNDLESHCMQILQQSTSGQFCEKNEVTPHYKKNLRYYNRGADIGIDYDDCVDVVVNGVDALPAEFPHQVYFANPKVKCGGTILNEYFILTAAHCFIRRDGTPRKGASTWKVVGGDTDLNSTEGTEQERSISIIYTHPSYQPGTPHDDIALVKLNRPFTLNKFLKAPLLPTRDFALKFIKYSALTVSGYGDLSYQGDRPTKLQRAYLSIYTTSNCEAAYINKTITMTEKIICAGGEGRDSCQGDSGGPLVFRRCSMIVYESVLVGVVIGGIECGTEEFPGLTQGDCARGGCCQNGGSCFIGTHSNTYSCLCQDGFKGINCEYVDLCGTCDYRKSCVCPIGQVKDLNDATRCVSVNSSATLFVSTNFISEPEAALLIKIPLRSSSTDSAQGSEIQNLTNIRSFDYHFQAQTLFWIDVQNTTIYSSPVGDGTITRKNVLLHDSTLQLESLAVDWIYEHIYWIDSKSHSVAMSDLNGTMRKTIISEKNSKPTSIVVNPLIGWIFWIESRSGSINKARLDGTDGQNNTWREYRASRLAVDIIGERLYWIQSYTNYILSSKFDGTDFNRNDPKIYNHRPWSSISIFEDYAYVLKQEDRQIYKVNKCNGEEVTLNFQLPNSDLTELKILSASNQPNATSSCQMRLLNCSHFCFPDPHAALSDFSVTSKCACPDGLTMSNDEVNCF